MNIITPRQFDKTDSFICNNIIGLFGVGWIGEFVRYQIARFHWFLAENIATVFFLLHSLSGTIWTLDFNRT